MSLPHKRVKNYSNPKAIIQKNYAYINSIFNRANSKKAFQFSISEAEEIDDLIACSLVVFFEWVHGEKND